MLRRVVGLALMLVFALLLSSCAKEREAAPPPVEATTAAFATEAPVEAPTALPATAVPPTDTPLPTPTPTPTPTPPAPLAAMVNGQYIFLADYEEQAVRFEEALVAQGLDPDTAEGQDYLAQARSDVLESLIDMALIEQGGLALGVTVGDEELEAQVEADISTGGGQAAFEEWLAATGQTREDYKGLLRQAMLSQRVVDAVTSDVQGEVEQIHVLHIAVDSEEAAQEILSLLNGGADFGALASQYSLDVGTKDSGGDLGWFPRGVVAPELEDAAFALQPGELSEPVPMGDGFHVILVVEREAARALSPEVMLEVQQNRFERWLEEQRAAAVIERFVGE